MTPQNLKTYLEEDLRKQLVSTNILCSSFLFLSENSRKSSPYLDHKFIPAYYYLGKYLKPKNVVEIGLRLGLFSGCFTQSCKTVEHLLTFQENTDEIYSPRLAIRNIRRSYSGPLDYILGSVMSDEFSRKLSSRKWDLALVNEELEYDKHRIYLDTLWNGLQVGGWIVSDYIHSHNNAGTAFRDFCKTKNRDPVELKTRYGLGIVQK